MLEALPALATTGIGSLPFDAVEEALSVAWTFDVPWLVELPRVEGHFMVTAATRGFPAFGEGGDGLGPVWTAFLARVRRAPPAVVKVQLAGPATVRAFGQRPDGQSLARDEASVRAINDHLAGKASRMVRELRALGVEPLVFFDEPFEGGVGPHRGPLVDLLLSTRAAGAMVGIHCCGDAPWGQVLSLPADVVSLDVRRSLDALLDERRAWAAFVERGGRLCLGVIPTAPGAPYEVAEVCEGVEAALRATTPRFERVLARALLSPACGLALRAPAEVERVGLELRQAQAMLRAVVT